MPVCVIWPAYRADICCDLDREPSFSVGVKHSCRGLQAAGDRDHEGLLAAHDEHQSADAEVGRKSRRVWDHLWLHVVPSTAPRCWAWLQRLALIGIRPMSIHS
jgi:hypothetical protein